MKFEFAKYTDVTKLAFKVNTEYAANDYTRIFLCCDTKVFWIARILEGYGEDYEELQGSYIVEREQIDKRDKSEKLSLFKAKEMLVNDSFENWDYAVFDNLDDAVKSIDGGYGINNFMEVQS